MAKYTSHQAFTIVELLVVIVVISVLASITVVAFTGIRDRAENSSVLSDLKANQKKLLMHHAEYGSFPDFVYTLNGIGACPANIQPGEVDIPSQAYCPITSVDGISASAGYQTTNNKQSFSLAVPRKQSIHIINEKGEISASPCTTYNSVVSEQVNQDVFQCENTSIMITR